MDNLSRYQKGRTAWATVNNTSALPGRGGLDCRVAKLLPGEDVVIADIKGCGTIRRIWMTLNFPDLKEFDNAVRSQALRLKIYWDGSEEPAVSVPLGDFFGHIMGVDMPFQNALFSDPTGRAYTCRIPMPFKESFLMKVSNEYTERVLVYHEINMTLDEEWDDDQLYFHAHWRQEQPCPLGYDFEVLPEVRGKGRYLGAHIGVKTGQEVNSRWAEGNAKIFIDDDGEHPTLHSGSVEDYYGSAWGWDVCFAHPHSGRLLREVTVGELGRHSFYRYHVADPVFFSSRCCVKMSQRSALIAKEYRELARKEKDLMKYIRPDLSPEEINALEEWELVHFNRSDDWQAVAFFYLDAPQRG